MCYGDDDAGTDLEYVWRKARKEHRCYSCRRAILPGHRYHRSAQVYDGKVDGFAHCPRCWAIVEALFKAGAETVQWDLACGTPWPETFGADPPDDVAALAFITADEAQKTLAGKGPTR